MSVIAPEDLLSLFSETVEAVRAALGRLEDWGPTGTRVGQYRSDLAADEAATEGLIDAGLGVCSEESGLHHAERPVIVALDPVDGSTNAALGVPWYATSLCAVDGDGALAAMVANLATGERYSAVRDGGAHRDGVPIRPSDGVRLSEAIIALSGYPNRHLGWRQFRALGSASLDLCAVAEGRLDGFVDCHSHAPWDYLGGMLVCAEAGAVVIDTAARSLITTDPRQRRTLLAAGGQALTEELKAALGGSVGLRGA